MPAGGLVVTRFITDPCARFGLGESSASPSEVRELAAEAVGEALGVYAPFITRVIAVDAVETRGLLDPREERGRLKGVGRVSLGVKEWVGVWHGDWEGGGTTPFPWI